jgi:pyridinium-3,5-biscarboxylic acid mononucleotide synthase
MSNFDDQLSHLLNVFRSGESSPVELGQKILELAIESNGSVTPDLDRKRRCGYPEVIYGPGKSPLAIQTATDRLLVDNNEILVTRVSPEQVRTLSDWYPHHRWCHIGRTLRIGKSDTPVAPELVVRNGAQLDFNPAAGHASIRCIRTVAVVSAGTTDEAIALEAVETLAWMGVPTVLIQDVGVAGPYRLMAKIPLLREMSAIVCVAGMEGALPSVLAGHVACPVIAVPTSVGYGANFQGLSALLSMLNCCASNVAVVNIDSGFKGAYMAGLIANDPSPSWV